VLTLGAKHGASYFPQYPDRVTWLELSTHGGLASFTAAGQTEHMHTADLDISKLSVVERIQLAEDLWDSVAADTGELPLTAAQTTELERRLSDLPRDPGAGDPWDVVRTRIEQWLHKAG